ncbi:hypothetical protein GSY74_05740 [Sulfurovum sp. bin170]|uniref:PqiC family protein n=1 Tax=Sulfurovum sp. bin170 TaxID=2695268 RepID=UPI0013DECF30|nr:ABC-type transport auxiliary lipoprotein family protein [Sulfurovum sp. bin170]NEW60780.1 hypothetical protein [Sulfurovum sp. bin170]
MQKTVLSLLIIVLFFSACGSKQLYTLGDTYAIPTNPQASSKFIAVEKVELPIYFMDSPIYIKDNPYHLKEIENANWINSMDVHMTNILISYLQKSMNNPNVYAYPWSNIKEIDKKVSVTISRFIAYKNVISLDANYYILDKSTKGGSNYLFNTEESIDGKSVESMIEAMEKAYFKLTKKIKENL